MPETKQKLTNSEIFQLAQECSAFLSLKLNLLIKYKFTELLENLNKILKPYNEIRNAEITRLSPEGSIPEFVVKDGMRVPNPLLEKFNKKMEPIDKEEKEFFFRKQDFNLIAKLESEFNYPLLFKVCFNPPKEDSDDAEAPKTGRKR